MRHLKKLPFFWKAVFLFAISASCLTAPFLNGERRHGADRQTASAEGELLFSCAQLSLASSKGAPPIRASASLFHAAPLPSLLKASPSSPCALGGLSALGALAAWPWPSQAALSCPPIEFDKRAPLQITWDEGAQPLALGWKGESPCMILPESAPSFIITRDLRRKGQIYELLAIPRDSSLQPSFFSIDENARAIHIPKPQKIPPHEYWVWGGTLDSPCEKPCLPRDYLPEAAFISHYQNAEALSAKALPAAAKLSSREGRRARGFFAFKFEKGGFLMFESPHLKAASIEGFRAPSPALERQCLLSRQRACRENKEFDVIKANPRSRQSQRLKSHLAACLRRADCGQKLFEAPPPAGLYGQSFHSRFRFDSSPRPCLFEN